MNVNGGHSKSVPGTSSKVQSVRKLLEVDRSLCGSS